MPPLTRRNVFLSGATGGIGQNLAMEFAKAGCNLFLTGRSEDKLKILKNQILVLMTLLLIIKKVLYFIKLIKSYLNYKGIKLVLL